LELGKNGPIKTKRMQTFLSVHVFVYLPERYVHERTSE